MRDLSAAATAHYGSETDHRSPGRPRLASTDSAILRAAAELIGEVGLQATTVTAVARRAGVARASVYLRWPSRAALIGAATKATVGGRPYPLTGDIVRDMEVGAQFFRDVVAAPTFKRMFPELASEVLADEPEVPWDALSPNRSKLAENYAARAAGQGLDPDVHPDLPYHLMVGGLLSHLLVTGGAPSRDWTQELIEVVVAGLRARGRDPSGHGPA
jgi:AcrR family transcriptional regulator